MIKKIIFSVFIAFPLSFTAQGRAIPKETPVEAGGWVDVKGTFTSEGGANSGVIMMCRPVELPSFQGWILRKGPACKIRHFREGNLYS